MTSPNELIDRLPVEVVEHHIFPYLYYYDRIYLFTSTKQWYRNLVETRRIRLHTAEWKRFYSDEAYRRCILELVGCIDPVTKLEVLKRKLILPEFLFDYRENCFNMLKKYAQYIFHLDIIKGCAMESALESINGLPLKRTRLYNNLPVTGGHTIMALRIAELDEYGSIKNKEQIAAYSEELLVNHEQITNWWANENLIPLPLGIESIYITNFSTCFVQTKASHTLSKLELKNCATLVNLSPFIGISEVILHHCINVVDVTPLRKAKSVTIDDCHQIANLEVLNSVPTLEFIKVDQLSRVDAFASGQVTSLTISKCSFIRDISMLGEIEFLTISECSQIEIYPIPYGNNQTWNFQSQNIIDFTGYENLYDLGLTNCYSVVSVSHLEMLQCLTLNRCNSISNLTSLQSVKVLELRLCDLIVSIHDLPNLQELMVFNCAELVEVNNLPKLHISSIHSCNKFTTISNVNNLQKCYIDRCDKFVETRSVMHVKYLSFYQCEGIEDVSCLNLVEELSLEDCNKVKSIDGLTNLYGRQIPPQFQSDKARWFFNDDIEEIHSFHGEEVDV